VSVPSETELERRARQAERAVVRMAEELADALDKVRSLNAERVQLLRLFADRRLELGMETMEDEGSALCGYRYSASVILNETGIRPPIGEVSHLLTNVLPRMIAEKVSRMSPEERVALRPKIMPRDARDRAAEIEPGDDVNLALER